ncbi:MAG: DUF1801 domain-containing protein [Bacteroidia bacterium]
MNFLQITSSAEFKSKMDSYPNMVKSKMIALRDLVLESANEIKNLESIEECLKWGEPSFVTKHGSTIRMDWKEKAPNKYSLFFKCTSKLVPTFIELYSDKLKFEGTREVYFLLNDEELPISELKKCIKAALMYHRVKHLPYLGMSQF